MTLDDVVKQLTDYKDAIPKSAEKHYEFTRGKVVGIDLALSLLAKADSEPPAETELEGRAWEIYVNHICPSVQITFECAQEWMDERDKRRAANAETT